MPREARLSNNVSSLRPNANSDYFQNTDLDERSTMHKRNAVEVTKVRNTMAPTSSANTLGMHSRMLPSKTPTLYDQKKRSTPFLKSDQL